MTVNNFMSKYFLIGIQQPLPRMHLAQFSSTVGLACGSSPFNDELSPVSNSPIHPNWMPHSAHRPYFRGALSNTNLPAVQPVFLPVDSSNIHFQRRCHHHPLPCHMSVYSCCAHLSPCGYSAFPKRPRLEEGKQLIPIETGTTNPVVTARLQSSQAHQTLPWRPPQTCRRSDAPPPLVKICQNGVHHKTSEAHSVTETRKSLHSKSTSVTVSKKVSSVQRNDSLKDSNKCRDDVFEVRSTTFRESSTTLCKGDPHNSPVKSYELSKRDKDSLPDMKSNTNGKKFEKEDSELKQCNTSAHDKNQKDKFVPLNHVKRDYTENRDRYTECKLGSYSIRPNETPEHLVSSKFCDEAFHCRKTRDDVQQKCKKQSFAKCREESFVSCDRNHNGKPKFCDANVKLNQFPPVCQCCNQPKGNPGGVVRRQPVIQHHQTPSAPLTDYKKERLANTKNNFNESNKPANQEYKNHPAISPTRRDKCNTELFQHHNQRFVTSAGDKIARCYPVSNTHQKFDANTHQKFDDASNKSHDSHWRLPESNVPQLCRGRPRTRGVKDKSPTGDDILTCSPARCQSRLSTAIPCDRPQCNRNHVQDYDGEVFLEQYYTDINNNNTVVPDKRRYQSAVSNDHLKTNARRFVNGQQTRRQSTIMDQSEKTMSLVKPLDQNTDTRITSPCEHYEKTREVGNNDRGRHQRSSPTRQYQEAPRNNCQKSPPVSLNETTNVGILRQSQKRERPLAPGNSSSTFVTSLNELLRQRTVSPKKRHRSNSFPFDEKQRQDDTQSQNEPNNVQHSHWQEERKEAVKDNGKRDAKSLERRRTPTNPDCSVHQRDIMRHQSEWAKAQTRYTCEAKEGPRRLTTVRLSAASCEESGCRHYKPEGSINQENQDSNSAIKAALFGQAPKHSSVQQNCSSSREVVLPPAEGETNDMDSGCGGYAIDHSFLPKIVAVHSIAKRDEILGKDESKLFSASDKKYWNDLLKKLTSEMGNCSAERELQKNPKERTPKVSHTTSLRSLLEESKVHDSQILPSPKDSDVDFLSNMQSDNVCEAKIDDGDTQWNMWQLLSSSSQNLTAEVSSPLNVVEIEEKKNSLPRKKPTVAELSEKILATRERIKQETIPWKKKLLHSLEAIFIKKLRKTEKETGEKTDISFEEEKTKDEAKEKRNGQKERRQSHGGKEKMAAPRHKQTTKKKL